MAVNPKQELIWEGRVQLGDEPGTFGDAQYSGICVEFPLTIRRTDPTNLADDLIVYSLEFEHVESFDDYPGHLISIIIHEPDATAAHFKESILEEVRLTGADGRRKLIKFKLGTGAGPWYLSLRIRNDISVSPGFYNDFVVRRMSEISDTFTFYSVLGFRN